LNTSTRDNSKESEEDPYYIPILTNIKIIDFGGATYKKERHSDIINTRQYRSPEVILGCSEWDDKSDLWSIACILVELYTGDLFFPTHNNEEHLCLIEKICGPIPKWMADNSRKEFRELFYKDESEDREFRRRVNYSKLSNKNKTLTAVDELQKIDV
jgi:serine/threonine protein kinase